MPRKILIVDDSALNRQLLINALQKDYSIIEAENGKEALALIHQNHKLLSAVLLDILMPVMDGYEVLRRMRENAVLSPIPVIMVTGSDDEDAKVNALSLGANDFIQKPFNPDIVRHCLRNCISLRESASILNAIQRDKLTGLYNRETFFDKAGAMIKGQEPGYYVLSCFDIDNFKLINDQYGAIEGDRILREIGGAIRRSMDEIGALAGRISADNFVALFPANHKAAQSLGELLGNQPLMLEQQPIVLSEGRYLITDRSLSASAIYDRAYIAKQSVKGRFDKHTALFDEEMLRRLLQDQQIVGDMELALTKRQFEIWFQPQYNHVTGALVGAEALVRWRHPQKGIVFPGDFIPLFEQNGFIYELDKYVLEESCRYLRKWIDDDLTPLPVSVNISRYDVFRPDLIDFISSLISQFDIPISLLHLEITESAFAQSTRQIVDIVKRLIGLGFTVEIDDFGSGYSSLNTLKSVPAQVVKLDMRFLEDEEDTRRGGNILVSVVRMAKWLGMAVIAEGVETQEQGDFLKSIGCSHVQGYLYSKPMPANEYERLFRAAKTESTLPILKTDEYLDNNRFWNPKSMDTLIFNSYVGAACIYEFYQGKLDLLRATDKFAAMLGDGLRVDDLLKLNLMDYLAPESRNEALTRIGETIGDGREITSELVFLDLPGCAREIHVKSTMRTIATVGDRSLVYCVSENTTQQRLLERKERRVAKQLQAVLDNVNCGITAVARGRDAPDFLLANDRFFALIGYTRQQYSRETGGRTDAVIFSEDRQYAAQIVETVVSTHTPASMEYRVVRRDGSISWMRSFLSMTSFEDVDEEVLLCTYADITSEKHTSQTLLDNLPCGAGICVMTPAGARISYLNKRFYSYFHHSSMRSYASSVYDAIHPDDREKLRIAMLPALGGSGEVSCVVRIEDAPGEYLPFRLTGISAGAQGASEDANAIYVTFAPISYDEISVNEVLPVALAAMMSSSSDLSFVKDKNLRYLYCSRSFAKMAGLESEREIAGKTDYDLFEKALADLYTSDDRSLMKSGESIVNRLERLPAENGRSRYSSTSKYLLYDSFGNVAGLYGNGRDVTQAREAEFQQKFLINSIPGGVATYEGQWSSLKNIKLTYFSDGFCSLFGYTREEYQALSNINPTSLILDEYVPGFVSQIERLVRTGAPLDYIYRARVKGNATRWIHVKAVRGDPNGDSMTVNAVFFDVTERQNALEQLRISEEENRLAIRHSKNVVCRYDVAAKILRVSSSISPIFQLPPLIEDVPDGQVRAGSISPETVAAYAAFYEDIRQGKPEGALTYQRKSTLGWRWIEAHSSTIFSRDGAPVSAVVSIADVTEYFEMDAAYKKWRQALENKNPASYSLFRCNLSRDTVLGESEGSLLRVDLSPAQFHFDECAADYAPQVVAEDRPRFLAFLRASELLGRFHRGDRIASLEYRETVRDDYRWIRLTVEMVDSPYSSDVEAYLLFEDINKARRAELLTLERAETDALTGLLNRVAFAEKVDRLIGLAQPQTWHALLMIDIDSFKQVNDAFGHGAGDLALVDIAGGLRSVLRREDLVGRLGGDEFVVFLCGIPEPRIASQKAKQICEMARRSFDGEVRISASVGIALYPGDGTSFESLYRKADEALYRVKDGGRDHFAFFRDEDAPRREAEPSAPNRHGGESDLESPLAPPCRLQGGEATVCRALLDAMGIAAAELNPEDGALRPGHTLSAHLAGKYDARPLWQILTADSVASQEDADALRNLARDVARDESKTGGEERARLKSLDGTLQWYRISIYKPERKSDPTGKLLLAIQPEDTGPPSDAAERNTEEQQEDE